MYQNALIAAPRQVKTRQQAMDANLTYSPAEQFAAAQDWWRDAGVSWCFADTAQNWLAPPQENMAPEDMATGPARAAGLPEQIRPRPNVPAEHTTVPVPMPNPATWPKEPEQFSGWWLNDPSLETGGSFPRIAPRMRAKGAELAVIVPTPEAEDRDTLLSGPQGRLLAGMLAAMGLAEDQTHVGSVLPRHTQHPDWSGPDAVMMSAVLRHHLGLVRPRRVLVFGAAILPLMGHDPAQNPAAFTQIPLEGADVPALAALDLKTLLERPRLRARFWHRWLEWTDALT